MVCMVYEKLPERIGIYIYLPGAVIYELFKSPKEKKDKHSMVLVLTNFFNHSFLIYFLL